MPALRQGKAFMFTINNPSGSDYPGDWPHVRYIVWQLEQGESGTPHYQGYVIFTKNMRTNALKTLNSRAHWENRRGTHEEAEDYCTKEDTRIGGPYKKGTPPAKRGNKSALDRVRTAIDGGADMQTIARDYFGLWCRYRHSFLAYKLMTSGNRDFKTEVLVVWGPTGVGKSSFARRNFPDAFWKAKSKWWDGYEAHEVVVLDDYYGWLPLDDLLRLLDRYPLYIETKGGTTQFLAKLVIFTSNKHPDDWYKNIPDVHRDALTRRLTYIHTWGPCDADNALEEMYDLLFDYKRRPLQLSTTDEVPQDPE
jgi:hypothetical protein